MKNSAICFPEVDKTCVDVFGILPGFLEGSVYFADGNGLPGAIVPPVQSLAETK